VKARSDTLCSLLEEIGFPAVRVEPVSAQVIGFNQLFSSLLNAAKALGPRLWFVEGVLPCLTAADRSAWESACAAQTPVQVQVEFKSQDGKTLDFEMRSFACPEQKKLAPSILCVFVPLTTPTFKRICEARLSEGRELERSRMRDELHRGVSQQLLGAAFGCKVLAIKVARLSEGLGKEASDLAELVNEAVIELQSLVETKQTSRKVA
jgi:hypothetical protein